MTKPLSVAVKAIIFHEGKVLLLKRSPEERKNRESHIWDFPGGSVEPGEQVMQALARELKEETSLEANVVGPAYVFDEMKEDKHLVLIKFACDQPTGVIQLSSEHEIYTWIPVDHLDIIDLPGWMVDEIHQAYQIYQALK